MDYIRSSIGKKQIVALSGFLLILFLIFHLSMNLLIFSGPTAFNVFPDTMRQYPVLLETLELGLAAVFLIHIGFTAALVIQNRRARKQSYEVTQASGDRSFAARSMAVSGSVLFIFLLLHLRHFTLNPAGPHGMVNGQDLGLYGLVVNSFLNPWFSAGYIIAMFVVGLHVSHGIQSVFQTFGFHHPRYTPFLQKASTVLGVLVALLFSSIPIYVMYLHQASQF